MQISSAMTTATNAILEVHMHDNTIRKRWFLLLRGYDVASNNSVLSSFGLQLQVFHVIICLPGVLIPRTWSMFQVLPSPVVWACYPFSHYHHRLSGSSQSADFWYSIRIVNQTICPYWWHKRWQQGHNHQNLLTAMTAYSALQVRCENRLLVFDQQS